MDQGDTSSSDWLDWKGIRGIRLGHWIPHQSAFHLLTTTPPTTMFTSAHTESNAWSLWNLMDCNTSYLEHGMFHFKGRFQGRTCKRFNLCNHSMNAIGGGTLGYPTNQQVGESSRHWGWGPLELVETSWEHWRHWINLPQMFPPDTVWLHLECNHNMYPRWDCWQHLGHIRNVVTVCAQDVIASNIWDVSHTFSQNDPNMCPMSKWWVHGLVLRNI